MKINKLFEVNLLIDIYFTNNKLGVAMYYSERTRTHRGSDVKIFPKSEALCNSFSLDTAGNIPEVTLAHIAHTYQLRHMSLRPQPDIDDD